MKKKLLLLAFFCLNYVDAQIIVTPNPFGLTSGTVTLTYGSAGDFSLFDPASDANLYLYTGLETDGVEATWDFHDTWNDLITLIPLTWNATANAYVATFDIGARVYFSEASMTNTTIPSGTMVNNWYFLIRNEAGTSQSIDFSGTDFGFTPAIANTSVFENGQEIKFFNGQISSTIIGITSVEIYNLLGQKLKSFSIQENETAALDLNKKGFFVAVLKKGSKQKSITFSN